MNAHASNQDLQADFQSMDTRMLKKFVLAIESDDMKQRKKARAFMSDLMDRDDNNTKRYPKLWAAMCDELDHQIDISATPIHQTYDTLQKAGYTFETIKRFEQLNSKELPA